MIDSYEQESRSRSSATAWITLLTAAGLTATAFILAKQIRARSVKGLDDVFGRCDRAAKKLDERLGADLIVA